MHTLSPILLFTLYLSVSPFINQKANSFNATNYQLHIPIIDALILIIISHLLMYMLVTICMAKQKNANKAQVANNELPWLSGDQQRVFVQPNRDQLCSTSTSPQLIVAQTPPIANSRPNNLPRVSRNQINGPLQEPPKPTAELQSHSISTGTTQTPESSLKKHSLSVSPTMAIPLRRDSRPPNNLEQSNEDDGYEKVVAVQSDLSNLKPTETAPRLMISGQSISGNRETDRTFTPDYSRHSSANITSNKTRPSMLGHGQSELLDLLIRKQSLHGIEKQSIDDQMKERRLAKDLTLEERSKINKTVKRYFESGKMPSMHSLKSGHSLKGKQSHTSQNYTQIQRRKAPQHVGKSSSPSSSSHVHQRRNHERRKSNHRRRKSKHHKRAKSQRRRH